MGWTLHFRAPSVSVALRVKNKKGSFRRRRNEGYFRPGVALIVFVPAISVLTMRPSLEVPRHLVPTHLP